MHSLTIQALNCVNASHGYGVVAEGLYGNSVVEECTFHREQLQCPKEQFAGGNLLIKYEQCPEIYTREHNNVIIRRSKFLGGYTAHSGRGTKYSFQSKATGISLVCIMYKHTHTLA